mgnify:CR=1 FL=1
MPAPARTHPAMPALADPGLLRHEGYVAGWRGAAADFPVTDPATGAEVARVARLGATEARAAVGKTGIVGVTCHDSRHLAMTAAERGADYVAFGAMYTTATKSPKASASPDIIEWWSELFEVPCVAIGGITTDNAKPVIEAGADFIAVSSGVWGYRGGPVEAVRAFSQLLGS